MSVRKDEIHVATLRELAEAHVEIARLTKALDEREADMHMRIRAGYDKTVADAWRAEVEKRDAEIARLTAELARVTECYSESHAAVGQLTRDIDAGREIDRQNVAEVNRLTAELAAARAVPADVEAAMRHYGEVNSSPCWTAKGHADAEDTLRTAIARAISDATAARGTVGGLLATAPECPTWCATHDPRDMATAMDGDRRYASPECRDAGRCLTRGPLPKGG